MKIEYQKKMEMCIDLLCNNAGVSDDSRWYVSIDRLNGHVYGITLYPNEFVGAWSTTYIGIIYNTCLALSLVMSFKIKNNTPVIEIF